MKTINIYSTRDLFVYGTSYTKDENAGKETNGSPRLNSTTWTKTQVFIKKGEGDYPVEILGWDVVKSLIASKVLILGQEKENGVVDEKTAQAVANKAKADVEEKEEKRVNVRAKKKASKLEELADKMLDKQLEDIAKEI